MRKFTFIFIVTILSLTPLSSYSETKKESFNFDKKNCENRERLEEYLSKLPQVDEVKKLEELCAGTFGEASAKVYIAGVEAGIRSVEKTVGNKHIREI